MMRERTLAERIPLCDIVCGATAFKKVGLGLKYSGCRSAAW
jgi:hypothetical protein